MMTLRSRRRRRVDCMAALHADCGRRRANMRMAALHADCGRRRANMPPAPPTWPRRVRLLALELW